jgi:hypothetical protein
MYLGIAGVALVLVATVIFGVLGWLAVPQGWWWALPALFVTERVWTVRRAGWKAMVLAAPIVIEFGYDLFQQAIYLRAAADSLLGRTASWHHVNEPAQAWGPWPGDASGSVPSAPSAPRHARAL